MLDILATISEPTAPPVDALRLLGWLVGIPLLTILLVTAAVLGPKWSRAGRWRPGQPWVDEPVWLGAGDGSIATAALSGHSALTAASSDAAVAADVAVVPAFTPGGSRGQW